MELKFLDYSEEGGIATIVINRPKALNAINAGVMSELGTLFSGAIDPGRLKGVIITGSGEKAFVAGADITEFRDLGAEQGAFLSRKGHEIYNTIERFPIPVVAAVNGFALGGGCELAMACHLRVASENARFGQPEVNLGLIPGYGGTQRLVQLIGKGKAMELLLTGDMIDAPTALQLGLVNAVVPQEELLIKARGFIEKIASKGPVAIAKTIACVNAYFDKAQNGFDVEIEAFGDAIASDESTEGVTAFLEKRKARFKNFKY